MFQPEQVAMYIKKFECEELFGKLKIHKKMFKLQFNINSYVQWILRYTTSYGMLAWKLMEEIILGSSKSDAD